MKNILQWIDSRVGIQGKLIIIFIVLSTIPLTLIGLFIIQNQINSMKTQSMQNIKIDIQELTGRTSTFFSKIESELHSLSRTTEMVRFNENLEDEKDLDPLVLDAVVEEFLRLLEDRSYYHKMDILDKNGSEVFAVLFENNMPYRLSSKYLSDRPFWFYLFAVEEVHPDEVLILPSEIKHPKNSEIIQTVSLTMPLFNRDEELVSILIAHIDFQEFIDLFDMPRRIHGGKIIIVDGQGNYIYNSWESDWNRLLANRQSENLSKDYSQPIADAILAGRQGTITLDRARIIEYASIFPQKVSETGNYYIFIDIETSVIFSKIRRFRTLFILLVTLVAGLSVLIGYYTARRYLRPIKILIKGAKNIKEGNLDYKFTFKSRDEIQVVIEGFNLLIKKAKIALRESEVRFHQIFKQSENAKIIFDPINHKIIDINSAALSIYGYTEKEIINRNISRLFEQSSYESFIKVMSSAKKNDVFHMTQINHVKKNGTSFKTAVRGKIVKLENVKVVYCDIKDQTEENRLKEEARLIQENLMHTDKMASLGTLASGVAHEINNPNNSIMLNISALSEIWEKLLPIFNKYYQDNKEFTIRGIGFPEIKKRLPKLFLGVSDSSRRIKNITNDLKDFARREPLDYKKDIDINNVVKTVLSLINNLLSKSTKHFSVTFGKNLPLIRANFQKLEQVIINLVQNACEALPDPEKKIKLSTFFNEKTNSIVIILKDEGLGIPDDKLDHITDPFFTTKRSMGGTGLGLSIASTIIRDHGGTMRFISEHGRGTTVIVTFPVKYQEESKNEGQQL